MKKDGTDEKEYDRISDRQFNRKVIARELRKRSRSPICDNSQALYYHLTRELLSSYGESIVTAKKRYKGAGNA